MSRKNVLKTMSLENGNSFLAGNSAYFHSLNENLAYRKIAKYIAILKNDLIPKKILKIYKNDTRFYSVEKIFNQNAENTIFLYYDLNIYELLSLNPYVIIIRITYGYIENASIQFDEYYYEVYIL